MYFILKVKYKDIEKILFLHFFYKNGCLRISSEKYDFNHYQKFINYMCWPYT